jgi:hypothetical protein
VTEEERNCIMESLSLYSAPYTVGLITYRRRWMEHVAHMMGEEKCIQGFGGETLREPATLKTSVLTGREF